MTGSLYDRVGPDLLRRVITDFYERVFADTMIGFLFTGKNKPRLIQKEWEFVARLLGAEVAYRGRSMTEAHARVPITGGHFDRRMVLLEEAIDAHDIDPEVRRSWLDHARSLRSRLIYDPEESCAPSSSAR